MTVTVLTTKVPMAIVRSAISFEHDISALQILVEEAFRIALSENSLSSSGWTKGAPLN
ncbi:hypothetical protein KIN20_030538 [Parelaphostrongylus tenuis]|uniref:Uncharacterized protein n=1 Tax=Parelaphostrongylus tenuis TaxID=148309 RepID=A0AAD5R3W4_PARTN|nr:hypothetical protein KIN20_030538 [Parelaphostrongylus tenuis]